MGNIGIEYCPTERMWSDILKNPNQDKALHFFRGQLINVTKDYDDELERGHSHPDLLIEKYMVTSNYEVLK